MVGSEKIELTNRSHVLRNFAGRRVLQFKSMLHVFSNCVSSECRTSLAIS